MPKSDPADLTSLLRDRKKHRDSAPENQKSVAPAQESSPSSSPPKIESTQKRKPGRPPGRRSNPDIATLNLLIDEDLVIKVRHLWRKMHKGVNPKPSISDLIEDLLRE